MAVVRWTLYDPELGTTLEFPLNPVESYLPQRRKSFSNELTTAGSLVLFEGAEEPQDFKISGVFKEESSYDFMVSWFEKRYQLKLTDDLGNEFWIYVKSFSPKRKRAYHSPWAFEYEVEGVILDWS